MLGEHYRQSATWLKELDAALGSGPDQASEKAIGQMASMALVADGRSLSRTKASVLRSLAIQHSIAVRSTLSPGPGRSPNPA